MGWFMSGVSQSLRDGIAAAQARQFDRARPLLEQATAEAPSDPVGWFWLAIASPSAGAAMRCLRRVLELDAAHEQARNGLVTLLQTEAQRLAAAGARVEARELAAEATRLAPHAQSVWLSIAALTDDQKERLDALRKAVAITPDDVQLKTRLRQALLARGVTPSMDRAEARACFKEAAAINPNDARVWQALAKLAETPAESVDALRELVRVAPDQAHGQFALRNALAADARALSESGQTEAACARWREVLAMSNSDVEGWLGVAATTSSEEEAVQAVETAVRLNPSHDGVVEAKARLERAKIDPSTVTAPVDAFARFDAGDSAAPFAGADDPFASLDSTLDAFAKLPDPATDQSPVGQSPVGQSPVGQSPVGQSPVAAEPVVDLEAVLEEAAPTAPPAAESDQGIALDFDAVMNSIDLSASDAKLAASPEPHAASPESAVVSQAPAAAPQPAAEIEKPAAPVAATAPAAEAASAPAS